LSGRLARIVPPQTGQTGVVGALDGVSTSSASAIVTHMPHGSWLRSLQEAWSILDGGSVMAYLHEAAGKDVLQEAVQNFGDVFEFVDL